MWEITHNYKMFIGTALQQRLEITGGSVQLAQFFPTLDMNKVVNVTGATLTDGIVSNYLPGQPVTYSYNAGAGANGQLILFDSYF